jgi:ABC-type Fe2+-enterobactin transport system substrate-binding protein
MMNKLSLKLATVVAAVTIAGIAAAQFPVMDAVAGKVIQKYQSSSCEQLWQNRGKPAGPEEQRAMNFLKTDPQMRQAFFDKIAGPVMNKMFECGMIP